MNLGKLLAWVGRFWLPFRAAIRVIFCRFTPRTPKNRGFFSVDFLRMPASAGLGLR